MKTFHRHISAAPSLSPGLAQTLKLILHFFRCLTGHPLHQHIRHSTTALTFSKFSYECIAACCAKAQRGSRTYHVIDPGPQLNLVDPRGCRGQHIIRVCCRKGCAEEAAGFVFYTGVLWLNCNREKNCEGGAVAVVEELGRKSWCREGFEGNKLVNSGGLVISNTYHYLLVIGCPLRDCCQASPTAKIDGGKKHKNKTKLVGNSTLKALSIDC